MFCGASQKDQGKGATGLRVGGVGASIASLICKIASLGAEAFPSSSLQPLRCATLISFPPEHTRTCHVPPITQLTRRACRAAFCSPLRVRNHLPLPNSSTVLCTHLFEVRLSQYCFLLTDYIPSHQFSS